MPVIVTPPRVAGIVNIPFVKLPENPVITPPLCVRVYVGAPPVVTLPVQALVEVNPIHEIRLAASFIVIVPEEGVAENKNRPYPYSADGAVIVGIFGFKNVMELRFAEANAPLPIVVTVAGILRDVRPVIQNAPSPIVINELGNVIEVNAVQLLNTKPSIKVIPDGSVTDVRLVQDWKT